jgi:hypothetical protein
MPEEHLEDLENLQEVQMEDLLICAQGKDNERLPWDGRIANWSIAIIRRKPHENLLCHMDPNGIEDAGGICILDRATIAQLVIDLTKWLAKS